MTVRDATVDDVLAIVRLLHQLSPHEGDPDDPAYRAAFLDVVRDARTRVLVVDGEAGEGIVATATVSVLPNLSHRGRPVARVESVVVDERVRGRGIGAALMRAIIDDARAAGCFRVELTSNQRRADAHRFYERLGFSASHVGFKLLL